MNSQGPPTPPAPQQAPQHYLQPLPLAIFQNPIPYQGVMNTQQVINPVPPQTGQYPNLGATQPKNSIDHIVLLTSEEILLQTRNRQYSMPPKYTPTTSEIRPATAGKPLMIPRLKAKPIPLIPHIPLRRNVHNPHAREAHNYSLVDDLAQSHTTMYVLEVLQTCSSQ
jgi:hypothetical protein